MPELVNYNESFNKDQNEFDALVKLHTSFSSEMIQCCITTIGILIIINVLLSFITLGPIWILIVLLQFATIFAVVFYLLKRYDDHETIIKEWEKIQKKKKN